MSETPNPTVEDLVNAYAAAEVLPDFLPPDEIDRVQSERRRAALATIQQIKDSANPGAEYLPSGHKARKDRAPMSKPSTAPHFAVALEFEPVAAHYYNLAGLSPLYLTDSAGAKPDITLARVFETEADAQQAGQQAKDTLWGIKAFQVEQIGQAMNDGPCEAKAETPR